MNSSAHASTTRGREPSAPEPSGPEPSAPATTPKSAVGLDVGDVIVAPDGSRHRVTCWTPYPHISVCFRTDTGHTIDVPWQDATTNRAYDIEQKVEPRA